MSFLNSWLRETKCPGWRTPRVRFIIRCMKGRPGEITRQAKCKVPIRDWRSCRRQDLLEDQEASIKRALCSLSIGRRASMRTESSVIPINSRHWVGRKVFFGARGILSSSNRVRTWQRAQRESGGGWAIKSSSRIWIMEGMLRWFLTSHSRASESWLKR